MAEEQTEETPEKAGKPILLILIVALVAVGAGLGGGFVLFGKAPAEPPVVEGEEPAPEGEAAPAEGEDTAADYMSRLLQIEPIVANIEGDGYTRLLKVKVAFECDTAEARDEAESRLPQLQDAVLTLVSSKKLADVVDFEGKALLKDDLRDRVNHFMTHGKVVSVLITEFVVQ